MALPVLLPSIPHVLSSMVYTKTPKQAYACLLRELRIRLVTYTYIVAMEPWCLESQTHLKVQLLAWERHFRADMELREMNDHSDGC